MASFVGKMNISDVRVSFFMIHTHNAAPLECNNILMFANMIRVDGFSVKLYTDRNIFEDSY